MKIFQILFFVLLVTVSCNDKVEQNLNPKKKLAKTNHTDLYHFNLPDTVYSNELFEGELEVFGHFDTINHITYFSEKNHEECNWRFIYYSFVIEKDLLSDEEIFEKDLDTFIATDKNNIKLPKMRFLRPGIHFINGILHDEVMLQKEENKNECRHIINEFRVNYKLVVLKSKEVL